MISRHSELRNLRQSMAETLMFVTIVMLDAGMLVFAVSLLTVSLWK
jgi:hypothetical protein